MKKMNVVQKKDLTPVYLDKKGHEDLLVSIEDLKQRIIENNKGRRAAFTSETNDGCISAEFVEIERIDAILQGELQRKYDILSRVVIVENSEIQDKVNIGDVVRLLVFYRENDTEEKLFKIIGGMPNFDAEIREISINSPIGKAIYQKSVGEICTYSVKESTFSVLIKEKVNLTKTKGTKVKKLSK